MADFLPIKDADIFYKIMIREIDKQRLKDGGRELIVDEEDYTFSDNPINEV